MKHRKQYSECSLHMRTPSDQCIFAVYPRSGKAGAGVLGWEEFGTREGYLRQVLFLFSTVCLPVACSPTLESRGV